MWLNGRVVQFYCFGILDFNFCMIVEQDSWSCDVQAGVFRNQGWSWVLRAKWGVFCRFLIVVLVIFWLSCCFCYLFLYINVLFCFVYIYIYACIYIFVMVTLFFSSFIFMLCLYILGVILSRVIIFYLLFVSQLILRLCFMGFLFLCFCGCFLG